MAVIFSEKGVGIKGETEHVDLQAFIFAVSFVACLGFCTAKPSINMFNLVKFFLLEELSKPLC